MNNTRPQPEVNALSLQECKRELIRMYRTRSSTPERNAQNLDFINNLEGRIFRLETTEKNIRRQNEALRKGVR